MERYRSFADIIYIQTLMSYYFVVLCSQNFKFIISTDNIYPAVQINSVALSKTGLLIVSFTHNSVMLQYPNIRINAYDLEKNICKLLNISSHDQRVKVAWFAVVTVLGLQGIGPA